MSHNKEVAKKETTAVAVQPSTPQETVLRSDVIIPKVLLMQGLSEMVTERKAMMGDMVRSTTGEKLGDDKSPLEIIPLTFKNTWVLQEQVAGKFEYRGIEPRTAANEGLEWDFVKNGAKWKRVKSIELFALLPADVDAELAEIAKFEKTGEMPDLNKTLLPVVISFRSTSYTAGKSVVTHFTKAAGMAKYGVKAHGFTLSVKCRPEKNDKGSYFVWDVAQGKKVSPKAYERAEEWYSVISADQNLKVDEAAEQTSAPSNSMAQF